MPGRQVVNALTPLPVKFKILRGLLRMDPPLSKLTSKLSRQGSASDLSARADSFSLATTSNLDPLLADLDLER